jgi:putative RNA 2'-phosphotransferase
MKDKKQLSKYMSLLLRHNPDAAGIIVDSAGWTDVKALIGTLGISYSLLEEIVKEDNKKRYSFSKDKSKIRANQGHSISVPDLELKQATPPDVLYHGTATKYIDSIFEYGLLPKTRNYVHLSDNFNTALNVGSRHGTSVVLKINSKKMLEDGVIFLLSDNGVWLTGKVNKEYISL